jgi:hypothetical protein
MIGIIIAMNLQLSHNDSEIDTEMETEYTNA